MEHRITFNATDLSIGYKGRKKDTLVASGIDLKMHSSSLVCLIGQKGDAGPYSEKAKLVVAP